MLRTPINDLKTEEGTKIKDNQHSKDIAKQGMAT